MLQLERGKLENSLVSSIKREKGATQHQLDKAEKTRTMVEKGLEFLIPTFAKISL